MCQHAKNQLIPSVHSEDTVNFRDQRPDWSHPFLTIPNQEFLNQLLNFVQRNGLFKNPECDWQRLFWLVSKEQDLSQIYDFCRTPINNINVYYRTN